MSAVPLARAPRAILFDLDGTLVHSAPDIAAAVNAVLVEEGLAPLALADVERMIGNGIRKLVERAFEARGSTSDEAELDRRHARMMSVYPLHLTNLTRLNPGASDAVAAARETGAKIAVVTNKPGGFSRTILDHFSIDPDVVVGGDSGVPRKPAPDMLVAACQALSVAPRDALMVGDSSSDTLAAAEAGMPCVVVRGGYSKVPVETLGALAVLNTLHDLRALLAGAPVAGR